MPIDNISSERNLLDKLLKYDKILDALNKIDSYGHCNLVETLAIKLAHEFNDIKNIKKIKIKK